MWCLPALAGTCGCPADSFRTVGTALQQQTDNLGGTAVAGLHTRHQRGSQFCLCATECHLNSIPKAIRVQVPAEKSQDTSPPSYSHSTISGLTKVKACYSLSIQNFPFDRGSASCQRPPLLSLLLWSRYWALPCNLLQQLFVLSWLDPSLPCLRNFQLVPVAFLGSASCMLRLWMVGGNLQGCPGSGLAGPQHLQICRSIVTKDVKKTAT